MSGVPLDGEEALYFECHITTDPAGERHEEFKALCLHYRFRAADLLMRKSLERSQIDSFCTGRDTDVAALERRAGDCMAALRNSGFPVRRYKIEAALTDERYDT